MGKTLAALIVWVLLVAASPVAKTQYGDLTLAERHVSRPELLALMPGGYARGYRLILGSPDLTWYTFAAHYGDSSVFWPRGQGIIATLKDGREIASEMIMVMAPRPECTPILLGRWPVHLKPPALERKRWRDGALCVVLFVGFATDFDRSDVRDVRVVVMRAVPAAPGTRGGKS